MSLRRLATPLLATLLTCGGAQATSLLPGWPLDESEPFWRAELVSMEPLAAANLNTIASRAFGRECAAFESIRWTLNEGQDLIAPLADISFYAYAEQHHQGVTFVDANLSGAYGYTNDEALTFFWGIPFGVWPFAGIYVHLDLCRVAD